MAEPLQSNLHLLTTEQRKTMAAMLRKVAANENLPPEDRQDAALRADELDPPTVSAPYLDHEPMPPSPLFDPREHQG